MKRGTRCVAQTINLSNPRTCIRPSQVQKLVNAEIEDPCPDFSGSGTYWTPKPIAVRVCTRKEMERACQPKLYDCSEKPPLTTSQKICKVLIFFIKSALVAGLIYWTHSEGVWGDSAETEDLYRQMAERVSPLDLSEKQSDVNVPHLETMKYKMVERYNHSVVKVMDIFVGVPMRFHKKMRDMICSKEEGNEAPLEDKPPEEEATE